MSILAYAQKAAREPLEAVVLDDPAPPAGYDVDVEIAHCSVCHSDVHLLDGDWGDVARPLVPGHEIVGRVVSAGESAGLAEGTWVGIGWQAGSCGACGACLSGREQLCTGGKVRTCVGRPGGFATRVRADARFCFALPPEIDRATVAPLLCAGLTVFSPLERLGVGRGKRVGVVGVGGLGHLAIRFARAMGADVIGFDPDLGKRDLARDLGASDLVDPRGPLPQGALDLLLVTTHAPLVWDDWMRALDLEGTACVVGVAAGKLEVSFDPLMDEQKSITGSVIGSPATMRRMLAFAAAHGIAPIVERMPLAEVNEAIARVRQGKARMRVVLDA
ncbi:MAG: NAD(P)-dependent alcohol dehydrogenase [Labilithrix sp.]|nr:NAD(P)-dependent alcohol dehydrogenase [Labilithrix sp.]